MKNNKSIIPFNEKNQRHGYWERYFSGNLIFKSFFQNDKLVGYEEEYHFNGKLFGKTYHI